MGTGCSRSDLEHVLVVGGLPDPVFDEFGLQPGAGPQAGGYRQPSGRVRGPPAEYTST